MHKVEISHQSNRIKLANFAAICNCLNKLLRKNEKFTWSTECQNAFSTLKTKLIEPTILQYPDFQKEFILTTDASDFACGAVLSQMHENNDLPVSYASRAFTKGEKNKHIIEKELAAIHWAIMHFRPYLLGKHFKVKTDHRPLVYLFGMKNPTSKLTRMRLDLEEFNFTIEYVPGKSNVVADALSRITSEELKSIQVLQVQTRSMQRKPSLAKTGKGHNEQELDQIHVIEAVNLTEIKDMKICSFNIIKKNPPVGLITISERNFEKSVTQALQLSIDEKHLKGLFKHLEQLLKAYKIKKVAISAEDPIFNFITINTFKQTGNEILKDVSILLIMEKSIMSYMKTK